MGLCVFDGSSVPDSSSFMGFSNAEIARKLFVTEATVKSHLSSSFAKLGVRSRAEATARILDPEHGLGTGILAISDDGRADS